MRVETESAQRLKDTFSSGTSATGEAGDTSAFESLPGTTRSGERSLKQNTLPQSETKPTTHKVGRQPESCQHNSVLAHRWQRRWWPAGPPPESNWAPDARPDWKAAVEQVVSLHTHTLCSPQVGWWTQSHLAHCGCNEAREKGGRREKKAINKDYFMSNIKRTRKL